MPPLYLIIKYAHISFALISISLFILRAIWSITESQKLQQPWVRVLPHINDSLLLAAAIYLMMTIHQYPFTHSWLTIKFFALLSYIVLGTLTLKRATTPLSKLASALLAVAVFGFMAWTALHH